VECPAPLVIIRSNYDLYSRSVHSCHLSSVDGNSVAGSTRVREFATDHSTHCA